MDVAISVDKLVQTYGRKPVLRNVSFEVLAGERFGVFGTAGSGKTALLHILAGIDRYRSGSVSVLGSDVRRSESFKKNLGLVTDERSLFLDLSVAENLDFFVILKGAPRQNIEALCHRLELDVYWRDQAGHLDAGVFQRLSLACALLGDPELLIVDDLFRDIDLESRQLLLRELNRYSSGGGTCIWGFSDIRCCPLVHRVGWLENGALEVSDPEQAMRAWEQRLRQAEAVYGAGWL